MDDQIDEGLCDILQRIWAANLNDDYDQLSCEEDSIDELKPYTVDNVPIRKLFIGNIAQRTTFKDLEKLFSEYGKVDSCYLKRNYGYSNFAFVTFSNVNDALKARKDGCRMKINLHNRDLRVSPADSWHQPDSIEYKMKSEQKISEAEEQKLSGFELNEEALINKLNDDCLTHIFTFLPIADRVKMERVCRRWQLASEESWRSFKKLDLKQSTWGFDVLNSGPKEISTLTLRKVLLRCGKFLTHIDLSTFTDQLSQSTLTIVGRLCPHLQSINITGLNVPQAGIRSLTSNCTEITEFSLGHCSTPCDRDLSNLFSKNNKLRYLKFIRNSITGKCLINLPSESVETVILEECSNISPSHFYNAIQKLSKLHTLSVEKCVSFSDSTVKAISFCSTSLNKLRLCDYFPMIRSPAMLHIADLVNIEILDLSKNVSVQDNLLIAVGIHCKKLTNVDVSSCHSVTNHGLAAITSLPKLEHLNISYLGKITDEILTDIPHLRTMQCRGCPSLENKGLCILVEESRNIEFIDFSGCNNISNVLIESAIKSTMNRTNNVVLKMYVGDTKVNIHQIKKVSPFLHVLNVDLSEPYLRPDFDHDLDHFFPDEIVDLDDLDDYDSFLAMYDDIDDDYDSEREEYYRLINCYGDFGFEMVLPDEMNLY